MEKLKEKKTEAPTFTASLHPDSRTYVWGGLDNMLHVCNYETGEQLEEYKGHFGPVHCVRYSPDGEVSYLSVPLCFRTTGYACVWYGVPY